MGIKVCPERNRHGEPPSFATLNQTRLKPTRPNRVTPSGTWYKPTVHKPLKSMVPLAGIEPALPRGNLILSQLLSLGGAARLGRLSSTGLTTRPMGTLATHRAIRGCVARDQSRIPRFRLPTAYQDW